MGPICVLAQARADSAKNSAAGAAIYVLGRLPDGKSLHATDAAGLSLSGAAAACANCHQRSGFGTAEGRTVVPPITAHYLFGNRHGASQDADFLFGQAQHGAHTPYTRATLARAIRSGLGRDGRPLASLMPHYSLDDAAMRALLAYLSALSAASSAGVMADTVHIATIVTADADAQARTAMLGVLQTYVDEHNQSKGFFPGHEPDTAPSGYRGRRRWQLHVWDLHGPPTDWQRQLEQRQASEPVFAVLSGLGANTWEPVHLFCEAQSIPCLFPNVPVSTEAPEDFYSLYYSGGVLLEARILASVLNGSSALSGAAAFTPQPIVQRVLQIYSADSPGAAAAAELRRALAAHLPIEDAIVPADPDSASLASALSATRAGDLVVLWVSRAALDRLPPAAPADVSIVVSGTMGGMDATSLPEGWRPHSRMLYPAELPALRAARMNIARGWLAFHHLPMLDERTQFDTLIACRIFAQAMADLLDTMVREYLVERVQMGADHALDSGYYPRLSLGSGQHFASKGGYLVHFEGPGGARLVADGGWIVP